MTKLFYVFSFALFLGVLTHRAEARRGVAIIGFGEDISHVVDLPAGEDDSSADLEELPSVAVGYFYNSFSLFFIPVATWGGKYVLFSDDTYWELTPEDIEEMEAETGSWTWKGNLWVKWVNWLWPLLIVAFILRKMYQKRQCRLIDEEYGHTS